MGYYSNISQLLSGKGAPPDAPCNTNNGTLVSGATWSTSVPSLLSNLGYSIEQFGDNSRIDFTSAISLTSTGAISLWFNSDDFNSRVLLGGNLYGYLIFYTPYTVRIYLGGVYSDFTVPGMSIGTWYH